MQEPVKREVKQRQSNAERVKQMGWKSNQGPAAGELLQSKVPGRKWCGSARRQERPDRCA